MRYLTILAVTLLTSCSWSWPWQWGRDSGNCVDTNTCDEANPFEEELIGGTWYCYGKSRDEPWDCSQQADDRKIAAVVTPDRPAQNRSEIVFDDSESFITETRSAPEENEEAGVFRYPDDSFAVQLIAVRTLQEADDFAARYNIEDPQFVRISTQDDNWYVVLLDVFDSRAEADAAAEDWNTANQPFSKPWVRPVAPLKAAARRALASGA